MKVWALLLPIPAPPPAPLSLAQGHPGPREHVRGLAKGPTVHTCSAYPCDRWHFGERALLLSGARGRISSKQ